LRQAPAVAVGRVYAAGSKGKVHAFDLTSGASVWEVETDLRLGSSVGTGEGYLVLGGLDGEVLALDVFNGAERWRSRVSSEVVAAPAVSRGIAVVRAHDGRMFGLAIADGERRWVYDRAVPALSVRGNGAPVVDSGLVVAGYDSGHIVALRLEDGLEAWEQPVAQPEGRTELDRMVDVDGELVFADGEVYAASYRNRLIGIAADSGRPLFDRDLGAYGGMALAGENLIVADSAGTVWALNRRTGAAQWRQEGLANRWLTTPAIQGNAAVVGDLEGYLHWLDLNTGQVIARTRHSKRAIRATPQVSDGVVVAVDVRGQLAAYRTSQL
jgi:outer membrane protein assembly factor BamB